MKVSGKKYGYNSFGLEAMTMQDGLWKPKAVNSRKIDEYYIFPWDIDLNYINLWNSFEIIDLEIYRRKEYSEYVDYMKQLEVEGVN